MSSHEPSLSNVGAGFKPARSLTVVVCAALFILGLAAWLYCISHGDAARAWRALLVNFIFFTPLAAGMVAWPAVAMISQGMWARSIERSAFAALAFAPVSLIAFAALCFGHSQWAMQNHELHPLLATWLNPTFLFARDGAALLIVWVLAAIFVKKAQQGLPKIAAGWLCFSYAVVFTLLGFDLVMSLDPRWSSTLFGWYFFMSAMYAAMAAWICLVIKRREATVEQRHDMGKLLVAMSLVTTYMMFSQLLPIWYENFPHEVRFVIPRLNITNWRYVSVALLATVYLGPLVLLLTRWSKRTPAALAAVAFLVLTGLWVERWWLVAPTLGQTVAFGLPEIGITAAFAAAMLLCLKHGDRWLTTASVLQKEADNER